MTEDLSGLTIKGYELSERIGAGGFGAVYTADQSTVGRRVAVKIILPGHANQPDFIRRFESEARLVARLEHPYIVPLYDYWRDPSGAYLVMRWLRGGSLHDALQERPFTPVIAAQILDQVAAGLSLAHRSGVVHRDIKPSNILLDEEGNAYLSDFGIAQELKRTDRAGREEHLVGTLDYLSPEQAKHETAGPGSDIYSLGVTLYEMLAGKHPFPGRSSVERLFKHINDPLPEIEDLNGAVNDVIHKATAKNPAHRYQDALEMAAAFRQAARLDRDGDIDSVVETLTPREQQILGLIVEGKSNRQIAQELFVELSTVKWFISQIYRKLGVRSRVQAMVRARELRLVVPGPGGAEQAAGSNSISIAVPEAANPYKGLKAFEAADSRDFFGREALIERVIAKLNQNQPGPPGRFLAIVGPSGSGKSSLVKAGLIPAVWRGVLPGSERWFVVEMMPGKRPLDELEVALTRVAANQTERLHEQLRRDKNGLLRVAGLVLPNDGSELVLVIDQFEELFTLIEDETERRFFLSLLQQAVTDPRSRVRVVIALRADFYHRPLQYPEFGELVRGQMETVLPLSAVELERAILRPAEQTGVRFEEGLVPTIIEDVRYQPGGLPLMQYALTELFDRREGQLLTGSAYEAIGGIAGALAGRAESLYQELDTEGQEATRQLFLHLTTVEQGMDDGQMLPVTRRRVPSSELRIVAGDAELMDEIVDTFAAYRLLLLDHDPATRRPTVEVAHEALLVCWKRLSSWLEESRDDLRQRRRLERLASDWQAAGRDPSFLLSGTQLDLFVEWAAGTDLALTDGERDFLAANATAREKRRAEVESRRQQELETARKLADTERARAQAEQLRAEEQTQTSRRLRWLAAGLAVLLMAAAGFALLAVQQARRADEQARLATARELGALALSNIPVDPERSILLALEAAEATYTIDGSVLPEVEETLHRAIQASRVQLTLPQGDALDFSPNGTTLATAGEKGTITIWDAASGVDLLTLSGHTKPVGDIAFSPDGKLLASVSQNFERIVWDLDSGRTALVLPAAAGLSPLIVAPDIEFGPAGNTLLSTAIGEETRIFDVASGRELISFSDLKHAQGGAFSPDGKRVAIGNTGIFAIPGNMQDFPEESVVYLRDRLVSLAEADIAFSAGERRIYNDALGITYSPDGKRVAAASTDRLARVWDAATGELLLNIDGHTGLVHGIDFSPDGRQLATASADGTARLWDADTGQELLTLTGHQDEVIRVAFGSNGQTLATSSLDGTTKLWDITQGGEREWFNLNEHEGEVRVALDPSGRKVATAGSDGTAKIWNTRAGAHLATIEGNNTPFTAAAFSPDGQLLALGSKDALIRLVEAETGRLLEPVEGRQEITSLAFHPDSTVLAAGNADGTVLLLNLETGDVVTRRLLHHSVIGLDFSEDGELLATSGSSQAAVWDVEGLIKNRNESLAVIGGAAGAKLYNLNDHADVVSSIKFSADGSRLLTASWDGSAIVWDAASGKALQRLQSHVGRVASADFSPDGNLIATAGSDGKTILWDAKNGEKKFVVGSWGEPVRDVIFGPDGKYLVTSDDSGIVRSYVVATRELLALAHTRVTRALTVEECQLFLHASECPQ